MNQFTAGQGSMGTEVLGGVKKGGAKIQLVGGTDTGGGIGKWQNKRSVPVRITRATLSSEGLGGAVATAACSVSVGQAASGTTSSANLIDTQDIHTARTTYDNIANPGTNGKASVTVPAGGWVTVSKSTGASAGFVGELDLEFLVLTGTK